MAEIGRYGSFLNEAVYMGNGKKPETCLSPWGPPRTEDKNAGTRHKPLTRDEVRRIKGRC